MLQSAVHLPFPELAVALDFLLLRDPRRYDSHLFVLPEELERFAESASGRGVRRFRAAVARLLDERSGDGTESAVPFARAERWIGYARATGRLKRRIATVIEADAREASTMCAPTARGGRPVRAW